MYLWVCRPGGYFGRASNMSLQHKEHVQCAFCFGYHPFSVKGMASFWRPYLLWYQPPLRKRKLGIEKGVWRGAEGGLELVAYQKREKGTDAVGTRLGGSATLPSTTTPAAPPHGTQLASAKGHSLKAFHPEVFWGLGKQRTVSPALRRPSKGF